MTGLKLQSLLKQAKCSRKKPQPASSGFVNSARCFSAGRYINRNTTSRADISVDTSVSFSRLRRLAFLLLLGVLLPLGARAQEISSLRDAVITNASPVERTAIESTLAALDRAVEAKEMNTLRFYGLSDEAAKYASLKLDARASHLAVSPAGALVRQSYRITGSRAGATGTAVLAQGTHEFFLARAANGTFNFTDKHWDPFGDVLAALAEAAREEWERPAPGKSTPPANSLLHLVVARRGGRWIALRRSRWDGALLDGRNLQSVGRTQDLSQGYSLDPQWLQAQMDKMPVGAGTAHILLQRGTTGWIGLGATWDEDDKLSSAADQAATQARHAILSTSYTSADAHKAYGIALGQVGLFNEAADELEKAQVLQPGVVETDLLKKVGAARPRDPETLATSQLQNEARVGLDPNHPSYLVSALVQDYNNSPSVLRALRLGLEYSRLGDDARAAAWLDAAQDLAQKGALRGVSLSDQAWIEVLFEHLQERRKLASAKPPVIIRSPLFVLRCWPNDLSAIQVLAALEAAQHTVYADFNIPMGCTEVLAWRNQGEFQRYTTRFSEQGQSEFVAALTLTKLISTREGPVVLGEEINVFTDPRMAVFHTVAHEYGHVAVRQLSHGRNVPTWFNEGIATSVEGGYDGYEERVRGARNARALLSMDEMLEWNVDGERAFLAYSQANAIIDYIVATYGKDAVLNILRQIGADTNPDDAFQNVLGFSQYELWRRWATSLSR